MPKWKNAEQLIEAEQICIVRIEAAQFSVVKGYGMGHMAFKYVLYIYIEAAQLSVVKG